MEKLQRSREDRIIAGVCGGLAKYFGVDSTLIRLIFIVGAFLKGITVLIYIVLAIIMPEESSEKVKKVVEVREAPGTEKAEDAASEAYGTINSEAEVLEASKSDKSENKEEQLEGRKKLLAYALILIGVLFFIKDFIPFWLSDSQLFAVILILIGIGLLVSRK